ncbi:MAG: ADP-ribosylglycohydrolase family protein [Gemmatales bacterium]|nr:ADP-ribosylglycohydrolase family protein [Gemmatales bacterium]
MLGAIAGDVIGSVHEWSCTKIKNFPLFEAKSRFTDDTVLTVAVADRFLSGRDYVELFHEYYHRYPRAGFAGWFREWAKRRLREPYNSFGNGSAMRVSPVAYVCDILEEVLVRARESAEGTHNYREGIKDGSSHGRGYFPGAFRLGEISILRHISSANFRTICRSGWRIFAQSMSLT